MLLIYQIKVGLCLIVFYLLWKLLLSRETFHRFNRVALLTVMALALVLPWVKLTLDVSTPVAGGMVMLEEMIVTPTDAVQPHQEDMATSSNYPSGTFWYNDPKAVGTDYMTYVPIIALRGDNRVANDGKENTYGAPIWKTGVGNIEAMVGGTRATGQFGEFVDFDLEKCAIYNPIFDIKGLVPANTNIEYEPFMYRVWRNCNDVRPYFYSSEGKPLFWPYSTPESHALIVERMTTEDHIAAGNEFDELAFGAKVNTTIEFVVRFYYKVVGANFTRDLNDNDELYYVVEARLPWNNIPTGVAEINNANTEVSKTYYNAQGVKSDKPFDGVNIVITRYSDGSTKTTKVIR